MKRSEGDEVGGVLRLYRKSKKTPITSGVTGVREYRCELELLLVQVEVSLNGASYCTTYHGVVTDTEEAHHFYVCGH